MVETPVMEKPAEGKTAVEKPAPEKTPAPWSQSWLSQPWMTLRDDFNRLFDETTALFRQPWGGRAALDQDPLFRFDTDMAVMAPATEVEEKEDSYRITLELPGMDEKAVTATVQDGVLTVKAEKKDEREEKSAGRVMSERRYGMYARSFALPADVDADGITAAMKHGVLALTLPRKAAPAAGETGRAVPITGA